MSDSPKTPETRVEDPAQQMANAIATAAHEKTLASFTERYDQALAEIRNELGGVQGNIAERVNEIIEAKFGGENPLEATKAEIQELIEEQSRKFGAKYGTENASTELTEADRIAERKFLEAMILAGGGHSRRPEAQARYAEFVEANNDAAAQRAQIDPSRPSHGADMFPMGIERDILERAGLRGGVRMAARTFPTGNISDMLKFESTDPLGTLIKDGVKDIADSNEPDLKGIQAKMVRSGAALDVTDEWSRYAPETLRSYIVSFMADGITNIENKTLVDGAGFGAGEPLGIAKLPSVAYTAAASLKLTGALPQVFHVNTGKAYSASSVFPAPNAGELGYSAFQRARRAMRQGDRSGASVVIHPEAFTELSLMADQDGRSVVGLTVIDGQIADRVAGMPLYEDDWIPDYDSDGDIVAVVVGRAGYTHYVGSGLFTFENPFKHDVVTRLTALRYFSGAPTNPYGLVYIKVGA